jgi:hypothetical protein
MTADGCGTDGSADPNFIHRRTNDASHGPPVPCKLLLWSLHTPYS